MRAPKAGRKQWSHETRPLGGSNKLGTRAYSNEMAEALVALLEMARDEADRALDPTLTPRAMRSAFIDLEERMDDKIHELTGYRFLAPRKRTA